MTRPHPLPAIAAIVLAVSSAPAQSPREVAEKTMPSVVLVVMEDARREPIAFGSGFVVLDGVIATNHHVIAGAVTGYIRFIGQADRLNIQGVVAADENTDLALLAVEGLTAPALTIADSAEVRVGDSLYVVGNPQGLEGTFSTGIVSAIREIDGLRLIQHTAPISPGSSGGPLLNTRGEVVGIALSTVEGGQNLNFAVPSASLSALLAQRRQVRPLGHAREADNGIWTRIAEHLRRAADDGDVEAMFNLALMHADGRGVARDDVEAVRWFRKAAELGNAGAMYNLGVMHAHGRGVARDDAKAVRWFRKAAEAGLAEAMFSLGVMHAGGMGVARDDAEAVRWYRRAAELELAEAMFNLAAMHAQGLGVTQDDTEAVRWWRKAAELGNADAMVVLALMYVDGRGVAKDDAEAVRWWRKAAELGDAGAMLHIGFMYADGRGVAQDNAEAVRWWRKAAELGHAEAMFSLGVMYKDGRGAKRDDMEAVRWFRKAAEIGHTDAMFLLGLAHTIGQGVLKDDMEAYAWFSVAAAFGNEDAGRERDLIENEFTPEARLAAQRRSRELFEGIRERMDQRN